MKDSSYFYNILGLDQKASFAEIKSAYRKKVKQYHPDLSADDDQKIINHLKMIRVNRAFFHFKKLFGRGPFVSKQKNHDVVHYAHTNNSTMLTKHKDPGYAYYKQGFALFSKIHPNSWYTPLKKEKFISTLKREETNDEVIKIVEELLELSLIHI